MGHMLQEEGCIVSLTYASEMSPSAGVTQTLLTFDLQPQFKTIPTELSCHYP